MDNEKMLKIDLLQKLKKMGKLNRQTANMILLDLKQATAVINEAFTVHQMFSSPFPDPDVSVDGNIRFANTKKAPVGINLKDLLQGLIIGAPGTGKSILTDHIALLSMLQGAVCWMFVKGNDAKKLIRFRKDILLDDFNGQVKKNFLNTPPHYPASEWLSILFDVFIQANTLYDGTKNFLTSQFNDLTEKYKEQRNKISFYEVYDFLKARKFPAYSRDARYNESALNRIGGMLNGSLGRDFDCSSSCLENLVFQNVIFNYKGLSAESSVFMINSLISWLAAYKEANNTNKVHLIITDDAMQIFDGNRLDRRTDMGIGYINHILFETRKYKIKFLVDVQVPSLISKGILGTSNMKCLLNVPNANEIKFMLDIMGVSDKEQREYAYKLDKNKREMLVKVPGYPEPFLANIPESPLALEMDKIMITSDEKYSHNKKILQNFAPALPRVSYEQINKMNFEAAKPNTTTQPKEERIKPTGSVLDSKTYDFLTAVNLNQNKATLTDVCKQANLTAGTGSRVAKQCESKGFIKIIKVNFGKGSPRYCFLTKEGCEALGIEFYSKVYSKGGGFEHTLYQALISNRFKNYKAKTEYNRNGKFMDVGINVGEKLIALEVAMTSVNERVNIEKDIGIAKANYVVVACKDNKVQGQVKNMFKDLPEAFKKKTKICLIGELFKADPVEFVDEILKEI